MGTGGKEKAIVSILLLSGDKSTASTELVAAEAVVLGLSDRNYRLPDSCSLSSARTAGVWVAEALGPLCCVSLLQGRV